MKTKVQQTSIEAYHSLRLGPQQKAIVHALETFGPQTRSDLASLIHWERSTVSGRMNELVRIRVVIETDQVISESTGKLGWLCKIKEQ